MVNQCATLFHGLNIVQSLLCFEGIFSHWKCTIFPLLFYGPDSQLVLGESATHGPGLLWAKILWLVFLISVELAKVLLLSLVHHSQHTGN